MGDPGGVGPDAIREMRDAVEQQSSQRPGAGDPNDLQLSAAARHVAAQLARAEGRCPFCEGNATTIKTINGRRCLDPIHIENAKGLAFKDPADMIESGEVVMVADGQEVRPRATSTAKSKGLRIVEECLATGEPFFVFRAHDVFSNMVLVHYRELIEKYGPDDPSMEIGVVDQIAEFKEWQKAHRALVKYPD